MGGLNSCKFAIGVGLCLLLPSLDGCQEPGGQSASSAPVASAPASSSPVMQAVPLAGLVAYQPTQTVSPLTHCNLERLNSEMFGALPLTLNPSQANTFTGWMDPSGVGTPRFWLRFDDVQAKRYLQVPIQLTIDRPDVLASDPSAPRVSGFALRLPANAVPVGQYHVYLAVTTDTAAYVCDNGRHVNAIR